MLEHALRPGATVGSRPYREATDGLAPLPGSGALGPPVAVLASVAQLRDDVGGVERLSTARLTEDPEVLGGPLVPVDEVVELELVDLAGIEPLEGAANVLEQYA